MKNIHVIPTDKPSRFYFNNNDKCFQLCKVDKKSTPLKINQNIYITTDEEIKEGDWYIDRLNIVQKSEIVKDNMLLGKNQSIGAMNIKGYDKWSSQYDSKKIILTTDQDLIKDGVQEIDNEFLEWFVKNPTCEYAHIGFIAHNDIREYKIIIPQEEPKQETLEEAAERLVPEASCELNNSEASYWQQGWIAGVKWQVEQIPSIIEQYLETAFISKEQGYKNPKDWFEQFKNK